MREIAHGFFHLREEELRRPFTLGPADLLLFVEGFEPRGSFALEHCDFHNIAMVAKLKFVPSIGMPSHSTEFLALLRQLTIDKKLIEINCGPSVDTFNNVQTILERLEGVISDIRQPRIVVDISMLPKVYFLAILGWAFKAKHFASIRFLYSPGHLDSSDRAESLFPGTFTEGDWELKQVNYLEGRAEVGDNRTLFAFIGADINKAEERFRPYETLQKMLIYPADLNAEEEQKVRDKLASFFRVNPPHIKLCKKDSAVDALIQLRKSYKLSYPTFGCGGLLFPFSTKLSSLAAGIFAAFDPSVAMYVRVPHKYIPLKVFPNGNLISVDIFDLTNRDAAKFLTKSPIHPSKPLLL